MPGQDEIGGLASLVFSGSSAYFTGKVLDVNVAGSVPVEDMTAQNRAATAGVDIAAGRFKTWSLSGTMMYDASEAPPLGATGTLTITYRDAAATVVRWPKAILESLDHNIPHDRRMEGSFTFRLGGVPVYNPT